MLVSDSTGVCLGYGMIIFFIVSFTDLFIMELIMMAILVQEVFILVDGQVIVGLVENESLVNEYFK